MLLLFFCCAVGGVLSGIIWALFGWPIGLFCLLVTMQLQITYQWMRYFNRDLAEFRKFYAAPPSEEVAQAIVDIVEGKP